MIDQHTQALDELTRRIEPFRHARDLIVTVPGTSTSHECAGRVKSTKTRPGNPHLKRALRIAALSIARSKQNTRLAARYRRIASRRGPMKALVAIEHTLLTAIWHMLAADVGYTDLGGDYYTRGNPDRTKQRAMAQLRQLGYGVTLDPLPATG